MEVIDSGEVLPNYFVSKGIVDAAKYEDEVRSELKQIQGRKENEGVKYVSQKKYSRVRPQTFGLRGKTKIAVIRT